MAQQYHYEPGVGYVFDDVNITDSKPTPAVQSMPGFENYNDAERAAFRYAATVITGAVLLFCGLLYLTYRIVK